jgi:hypothetical protein
MEGRHQRGEGGGGGRERETSGEDGGRGGGGRGKAQHSGHSNAKKGVKGTTLYLSSKLPASLLEFFLFVFDGISLAGARVHLAAFL